MWIDDWVGNAILFSVVVKLYNKGQARVYGCKKGTVADCTALLVPPTLIAASATGVRGITIPCASQICRTT